MYNFYKLFYMTPEVLITIKNKLQAKNEEVQYIQKTKYKHREYYIILLFTQYKLS